MMQFLERREERRIPKKKIVVLYHNDCSDGFGAAWAAWKKFGAKAEYISAQHQEPPPKGLQNKEIYLLDFTYFGKDFKKLKKNNYLTTIDHHIGAKKETMSAHRYSYALNHSGAVLTWKFLHPKKPVPRLLQYVEGRDLWKFKFKETQAILTVVDLFPFKFAIWNKIANDLENTKKRGHYRKEGLIMLRYQEKELNRLIEKSDEAIFLGRKTWVVNSLLLKSEIGNALVKKGPPLAIVWHRRNKRIYVSLRSDGKIDVSKLAKKYGGGGHKAAAGFTYDVRKKLPWRYL